MANRQSELRIHRALSQVVLNCHLRRLEVTVSENSDPLGTVQHADGKRRYRFEITARPYSGVGITETHKVEAETEDDFCIALRLLGQSLLA